MNNTLIKKHETPCQYNSRRSAQHEPHDDLHVRSWRDKKSFEQGADTTSRNPSHKRLDGCCYRGHPATQHVYHRDPIRDDLHTWSHPMLRPSDSREPVLFRRRSSHSTDIWVLFALWCEYRCGQCPCPIIKKNLQDAQRKTLLTDLLQSSSQNAWQHQFRPSGNIGNAHFLIGGDMNTTPLRRSYLLQTCRDNDLLRTKAQTHERNFAMHVDLCVLQASALTTTAPNHDRQHEPYGICWSSIRQRSATEQPSSIRPGKQQSAAPSSGYATEQSLTALSAQASWPRHQTASSSSSVWDQPLAALAGGSATEQPLPARPTPPPPPPPTPPPLPAIQATEHSEERLLSAGTFSNQKVPCKNLKRKQQLLPLLFLQCTAKRLPTCPPRRS